MDLNYHCADCGHAWQGMGGRCPRCGSGRVAKARGGTANNKTVIALAVSLVILLMVLMQVVRSTGILHLGQAAQRFDEVGFLPAALGVERVHDGLLAVEVTVQSFVDDARSVSMEDLDLIDQDYNALSPVAVWPDGSDRQSAYLPGWRALTITGVVEVAPGTERLGICYFVDGESKELWISLD